MPVFTTRVEMDCYTNHFPGLPCFKKLTADKHVLAELLLVPFVIINLTRLTVGVHMKVRFKSTIYDPKDWNLNNSNFKSLNIQGVVWGWTLKFQIDRYHYKVEIIIF